MKSTYMFNGLIPDGTDSYNELQFFASLKTILQQQSINREEFRNFDPKEGVQQVRRSSTTVDAQLQILKEKHVETCYIRKKTEIRNFKYGNLCFDMEGHVLTINSSLGVPKKI